MFGTKIATSVDKLIQDHLAIVIWNYETSWEVIALALNFISKLAVKVFFRFQLILGLVMILKFTLEILALLLDFFKLINQLQSHLPLI